eukprot:scaffold664_cov260-Pinguiococcus_pyrenoidosus.AAC.29
MKIVAPLSCPLEPPPERRPPLHAVPGDLGHPRWPTSGRVAPKKNGRVAPKEHGSGVVFQGLPPRSRARRQRQRKESVSLCFHVSGTLWHELPWLRNERLLESRKVAPRSGKLAEDGFLLCRMPSRPHHWRNA